MGTFRVEIQAVGNHGCHREIGDGGTVADYCNNPSCVDCITREFVKNLAAAGAFFQAAGATPQPDVDGYARLTHWPGQPSAVVDDLQTGVRKGSF